MDSIIVVDLEVFANHGVYDEEKKLGQKFLLSCEAHLSTREAAMTGELDQSVHYGTLCDVLEEAFTEQAHDLIETAAEIAATEVLSAFPAIRGLSLTVKKPWAPIGKPLAYAAVHITRAWKRAFVGLGTNLGERNAHLEEAASHLANKDTIRILKTSSVYETAPWGVEDQPDFLNQVIELETFLSPDQLMRELLNVEKWMGRIRETHWGPRIIDLDLLYVESIIQDSDHLTLPHPYVSQRAFVLEPLAEIAPHFVDPLRRTTILELWNELKTHP